MEPNEEGKGLDDEAIRELMGEHIVYDRKTGEAKSENPFLRSSQKKEATGSEGGGLFAEEAVEGEKFGAVLPWLGALVEPSEHPPFNPKMPAAEYELEYVYGYRTYDCRQNLYFTSTGKVVYNIAALGIILDPATNTQKFFGGGSTGKTVSADKHNDDIICLSISPDRKYVATGQVGATPSVYIWDAETGKLKGSKSKCIITAKNTRGISACSWSSDNKYVAFLDRSDKPIAYVMDPNTGAIVYKESTGATQILAIAWSKKLGDHVFATCGNRTIVFWDADAKSHKMGTGHAGQSFSCVTYDDKGTCYAGGVDGNIYVFKGNSVSSKKVAHKVAGKTMIHAINWVDDQLFTSASDKTLCVFNSKLALETKISLPDVARSIDKQGDKILVGMRNGTIAIIEGGKITTDLMKSHHDGEIWGLEVLENGDILTGCDDNKVMLWDTKGRKNKGVFTINQKAGPKIKYGASSITAYPDNQCSRAICYNPKTKEVAVATNAGEVQIRDLDNLGTVKKTLSAAKRWIESMVYSPDGNYLAVGTHSNTIVVYNTSNYSTKGTLKGHNSSILSIDWSKDSSYIRSNCEAYELLFFNIDSMKQDPSGASNTKSLRWATQNTKIGWSVTGIFPKGTDGSHVNGVSMSNDEKLIASGDDWGLVNIYNNPCREGSQPKSFLGHSEHVVRVKFNKDDKYLFSVGGQDKAVMQWKRV
jgi:WD40 repeat protein